MRRYQCFAFLKMYVISIQIKTFQPNFTIFTHSTHTNDGSKKQSSTDQMFPLFLNFSFACEVSENVTMITLKGLLLDIRVAGRVFFFSFTESSLSLWVFRPPFIYLCCREMFLLHDFFSKLIRSHYLGERRPFLWHKWPYRNCWTLDH